MPFAFYLVSFLLIEHCKNAKFTSSSQAKGTKSTTFLTHVRKECSDLVPLACEDEFTCAVLLCI